MSFNERNSSSVMGRSTAYRSIEKVKHDMRHERAYGVTHTDEGHVRVYAFRSMSAAKKYRASLLAQHNLRNAWQSSAFPCWYLLLDEGRMYEIGTRYYSRQMPITELVWMEDRILCKSSASSCNGKRDHVYGEKNSRT